MDNKVAIEVALANINSTSQILSDNPSFDVISSNLNAIKLILENQLGGSTVTITPDKPVAIPPRKKAKANTYSVLVNDTTGWLPASDSSTKLSKVDANQQYLNLMDVEGYAPDRIKIVADGQVD
tara:strand:+ start:142 stop:513 length:372 start_codon:yes stop_codon:yes gene_type:complete